MITKRIMALLLFVATVASVIVVNASAFTDENSEVSTDGFITIDENTDLAALGLEGAVVFEKDSDEASEDNSAQTDSVDKGEQPADNVTAVPNVMASDPVVYDFDKAEEPDLDESAVIEDGDEAPTEEVAESSSEVLIEDVAHESAEESNEVSSDVSAEPTPVTPNTSKTPTSVTPQSVIDREYETKVSYPLGAGNYTTRTSSEWGDYKNMTEIEGGTINEGNICEVWFDRTATISKTVHVYGTLTMVVATGYGGWQSEKPIKTGPIRKSGFTGPMFHVHSGGKIIIYGVTISGSTNEHFFFIDGNSDATTATDSMIVMDDGSSCEITGAKMINNHVASGDNSVGGAIRMNGGELTYKDLRIENCFADKGGAIYATGGSTITLEKNTM